MPGRDDFTEETIRKLGERVNLLCSNPDCRAQTKAAHTDGAKSVSVGRACHIHAAAAGGPRYLESQTPEQRRAIENAIWLCTVCAALIDADPAAYPADLLRAWRVMAEHHANQRIGKPAPPTPAAAAPAKPEVSLTLGYKKVQILPKGHSYELVVLLKNEGTKRFDDWYLEVEFPRRFRLGAVYAGEVQRPTSEPTRIWRTQHGNATAGPGRKPLHSGDEYRWGLHYSMDETMHREDLDSGGAILDLPVAARFFVDGELVAEVKKRARDFQCF